MARFLPLPKSLALRAILSPLVVSITTAFVLLVAVFYNSPIREHVEEYFFDVRTKLKPRGRIIDDIVLVNIDDVAIKSIEGSSSDKLSLESLLRILSIGQDSAAKVIVVGLLSNVFDYEDPRVDLIISKVRSDPRIVLGTLGFNSRLPSTQSLPEKFRPIPNQFLGMDILKKRSNSVVRHLYFQSYLGQTMVPMLPTVVAKMATHRDMAKDERYYLNYWDEENFNHIPADALLREPERWQDHLRDKVVVIGYTSFRPWLIQTSEQMFANTPLKGNIDTFRFGQSVTYINAIAIENLVHDSWLKPAPTWWNLIQVAVISVAFAASWMFGSILASLFIFQGWVFLLILHAYLFEYFSLYLPLADTALFSTCFVVGGALIRLNQEIKQRALARVEAEAQEDLAILQGRFLNRFATELAKYNDQIWQNLRSLTRAYPDPKGSLVLGNAVASCQEFDEYLTGIKQFAQMDDYQAGSPSKSAIRIAPLLKMVVSRFEAVLQKRSISVSYIGEEDTTVFTNREILDTIVFNLVSNAIKYSPDHTQIKIGIAKNKKKVTISVTDQGIGIAPEFYERIFEKFYRIKDDYVYRVKGTGLGLFLCRYFAEKIEAKIALVSEKGSGSTFTLTMKNNGKSV